MNTIPQFTSQFMNAILRKKEVFSVPFSILALQFACVLLNQGYIKGFQSRSNSLDIFFKSNEPSSGIRRFVNLSKPSRQLYISVQKLRTLPAGFDIYVLSTSQGLLSHHEALQQNLGGKLLCKICS